MSHFFAGPKRMTPYIQTAVIKSLQGQPLFRQSSLAQLVDRQSIQHNSQQNNNDDTNINDDLWIFGRVSDGAHIVGVCFRKSHVSSASLLQPGCIVKITHWRVSTKRLCQEQFTIFPQNTTTTPAPANQQQSSDAMCLVIEGTIESIGGGNHLGIVGTPLEESIRFRQWFQEYRRDWNKIRSIVSKQQEDSVSPKLLLGDLATAMDDTEFCESLLRQADQLKQIFAKQDTAAATTNTGEQAAAQSPQSPGERRATDSSSSTMRSTKRLRIETPSKKTTTAAVSNNNNEEERFHSPVEDSDEEDLDIDNMLVSQPQEEPIPLHPQEKTASNTNNNELNVDDDEEEEDPLKEQPIQPVDVNEADEQGALVGDPPGSSLPPSSTTAAATPISKRRRPPTRSDADSVDSTNNDPTEERPIALQDANDTEIRRAYLQAEQASPSILQRRSVAISHRGGGGDIMDNTIMELPLPLPLDPPAEARVPSKNNNDDDVECDSPSSWPWKPRPDSLVEQLYRGGDHAQERSTIMPAKPPPPRLLVVPHQWRGRALRMWMEDNCMVD